MTSTTSRPVEAAAITAASAAPPGRAGVVDVLDDGHGGVGGEPGRRADEVDVEQRVPDDDQRRAARLIGDAHRRRRSAARGGSASTAASKAAHTRCSATRWHSCTVAVHGESMQTASSAAAASGLGAGPVIAQRPDPALPRPPGGRATMLG